MNVIVVESPTKAETISKYLGDTHKVLATKGHVRDLSPRKVAVRPDEGFAMDYEVIAKRYKEVDAIVEASSGAEALYFATDPDREGEAIAWHVLEILKRRKTAPSKVYRVTFREVTRQAVLKAFENPRDIDMNLVDAHQARRALDRLVGFTLSPILWQKLPNAQSAGRVQSVALRLICEREDEIEVFKPREYWSVEADFEANGKKFTTSLVFLDGKKIEKFDLPDVKAATDAAARFSREFFVASVRNKRVRHDPPPPFTTSTLQQEVSKRLGRSVKQAMESAQALYEGTETLITYMRTDSVNMPESAVKSIRSVIRDLHGQDYLPDSPHRYRNRLKYAEEAHEAIRPTDPSRTPESLRGKIKPEDLKLYQLVWQRTLASQMKGAEFNQTSVFIQDKTRSIGFRASTSVKMFDGFQKLYREGADDKEIDRDIDESTLASRELPSLAEGQVLDHKACTFKQHFTQPPPRYTEASLVRRLEELGVGRPSTYVSMIDVQLRRNYARFEQRRFVPEVLGRLVIVFLRNFFARYIADDFTANLEEQFDDISRGKVVWKSVLGNFWPAFKHDIDEVRKIHLHHIDEVLEPLAFPDPGDGSDPRLCPRCRKGQLSLKINDKGDAFFGCSRFPECTGRIHSFGNDRDGHK